MRYPLIGCIPLLAILGCSVKPVTPLTPYSLAADGLVIFENTCEDPLIDQVTLTPLEATADMFGLPAQMSAWTARWTAYIIVGIPAVYSGKDAEATVNQINYVIPMPTWGPDPDKLHERGMIILREGCL